MCGWRDFSAMERTRAASCANCCGVAQAAGGAQQWLGGAGTPGGAGAAGGGPGGGPGGGGPGLPSAAGAASPPLGAMTPGTRAAFGRATADAVTGDLVAATEK